MSAMQQFYAVIRHGLEIYNPAMEPLIQLTQANPAQVRELSIDRAWGEWPAVTI